VSLNFTNAQNTCEKVVAFDNMETWDWSGVWWTTTSLVNNQVELNWTTVTEINN
jgi:hypothetical protein